mmetsp:Transcript_6851/g.14089  ORF Transcript_6851/g.14089 Transcript_6851/m.14089 type:complete len:245 (+) Transcript_6851:1740-2474(+)
MVWIFPQDDPMLLLDTESPPWSFPSFLPHGSLDPGIHCGTASHHLAIDPHCDAKRSQDWCPHCHTHDAAVQLTPNLGTHSNLLWPSPFHSPIQPHLRVTIHCPTKLQRSRLLIQIQITWIPPCIFHHHSRRPRQHPTHPQRPYQTHQEHPSHLPLHLWSLAPTLLVPKQQNNNNHNEKQKTKKKTPPRKWFRGPQWLVRYSPTNLITPKLRRKWKQGREKEPKREEREKERERENQAIKRDGLG